MSKLVKNVSIGTVAVLVAWALSAGTSIWVASANTTNMKRDVSDTQKVNDTQDKRLDKVESEAKADHETLVRIDENVKAIMKKLGL